jgi:hypothetical protein
MLNPHSFFWEAFMDKYQRLFVKGAEGNIYFMNILGHKRGGTSTEAWITSDISGDVSFVATIFSF